jgi:hypothetical protein
MKKYLIASIGLAALADLAGGCAQATNPGSSNTGNPTTGPYSYTGSWTADEITCNGTSAGGSSIASPNSITYSLTSTAATVTQAVGGCTIVTQYTVSESGSAISLLRSSVPACSPAVQCTGVTTCQTTPPSPVPAPYNILRNGSTMIWISTGTGDTTCTGATPSQSNPVGYTFQGS